jgi:hypothetical protein
MAVMTVNCVYPKGKTKAEVTKMVFTVYMNENGKAVAAGNVSAPDYKTAKEFVISEGYDEKDFMLIKIEG